MGSLQVSFILATHNRCDVLAHTLERIQRCELDRGDYEIIVVDNASADRTAEAARGQADRLIPRKRNEGSCAKAHGVPCAKGRYVVFLDDDSFPRPGSIARMIEHFERNPKLAAAGFTVYLPDGRREGGALPGVFVGCGVGLRAEALRAVGGLDAAFFMQAEEYDLCFRLAGAGWEVEVFGDLAVEHWKTAQARRGDRTIYLDTRNNLCVIARYLPVPAAGVYREDSRRRYAWLAEVHGCIGSFRRGARAAGRRGWIERWRYRRQRLTPRVFERFFRWEYIHGRMKELSGAGIRRIVLADLGKNVYPFVRAAREERISILAVGDDRFAAPGRSYRAIPVVPMLEALDRNPEAVVVGSSSPVHGSAVCFRVREQTTLAVHHWFPEEVEGRFPDLLSTSLRVSTDELTTRREYPAGV